MDKQIFEETKLALEKELQLVAELRKLVADRKTLRDRALEELQKAEIFQFVNDANQKIKEVEEAISEKEDIARVLALSLSAETGYTDRKHSEGIEIKKFTRAIITDETSAKLWVSQNAPSLLKIDEPKVKKAVEYLNLPWITVEDEYRAQIASDLSEYLKEDENN